MVQKSFFVQKNWGTQSVPCNKMAPLEDQTFLGRDVWIFFGWVTVELEFGEDVGFFDMSHEKIPGWLGYIGDEILPSYMGIIS